MACILTFGGCQVPCRQQVMLASGRRAAVANQWQGCFWSLSNEEQASRWCGGPWYTGTKRYMWAGIGTPPLLTWVTYRAGWHRSANIFFDCGSNLRRAAWGASVQARGTDNPSGLVDCAQRGMLVCSGILVAAGVNCLDWWLGERKDAEPPWHFCARTNLRALLSISFAACGPETFLTHDAAGPGDRTVCPCPSGIGHPAPQSTDRLCYTPRTTTKIQPWGGDSSGRQAILYPGAPQWSKEDRWTTDLHIFLTSFDDVFPARRWASFDTASLVARTVPLFATILTYPAEHPLDGRDSSAAIEPQNLLSTKRFMVETTAGPRFPPVMMSTSLHQYPSAFSHLPAPNMVDHQQHHHLAAQHMGPSPLDTLAHTSQYAALQYHQNRHVLPNGKALAKPHRLPYASGPIAPRNQRDMLHERSGRGSATSGPVRRRISRACDQCNQLRTKCDGRQRYVTLHTNRIWTRDADQG